MPKEWLIHRAKAAFNSTLIIYQVRLIVKRKDHIKLLKLLKSKEWQRTRGHNHIEDWEKLK